MTQLIPPINVRGLFNFKEPFATVEDKYFTVSGVVSIRTLVAQGKDILTEVYLDNTLTQEDYNADLEANVILITLITDRGVQLTLPSEYLLTLPEINTVDYHHLVLGVSLGSVPKAMSLEYLKEQLISITAESVGITPTVSKFVVPTEGTVSLETHIALEEARTLGLGQAVTARGQLDKANAAIVSLQEKVTLLQQALIIKTAALEAERSNNA